MARKAIVFLVLLAFSSASAFAGIIWLKPEVHLDEGFVRLSQLMVSPDDKYDTIYLGAIKAGQSRDLELRYITKRIERDLPGIDPKVLGPKGTVTILGHAKGTAEEFTQEPEPARIVDGPHIAPKAKYVYCTLKKNTTRDTIIKADMLTITESNKAVTGAYSKPEQLIGKSLRRHIRAHQIITPSLVQEVPIVERGQWVSVRYDDSGIQISALARAMDDGSAGEVIEVRRDGETLKAEVLNKETVKILP